MSSVAGGEGRIHLGMDTSKNKIAVAVLRWGEQTPDTEMIVNDEASVRRLVGRFPDRGLLRTCYEAGPTGFGLHRLLTSMGVACEVIAPALIPKAPADRVKTDRRDARRLARLHRAGELVAIRIRRREDTDPRPEPVINPRLKRTQHRNAVLTLDRSVPHQLIRPGSPSRAGTISTWGNGC